MKVRYKLPDADESTLMTQAVRPGGPAPDLPFAAAVAEFGMLLRDVRASIRRGGTGSRAAPADESPYLPSTPPSARTSAELVDLAAGLAKLSARTCGADTTVRPKGQGPGPKSASRTQSQLVTSNSSLDLCLDSELGPSGLWPWA